MHEKGKKNVFMRDISLVTHTVCTHFCYRMIHMHMCAIKRKKKKDEGEKKNIIKLSIVPITFSCLG